MIQLGGLAAAGFQAVDSIAGQVVVCSCGIPTSPHYGVNLGGLALTKVSRQIIVKGKWHEFSCAVRADGVTSPAREFLEALQAGHWKHEVEDLKPDEQISDGAKFLSWIEFFAEQGYPPRRHHINYLDEGIWEFRKAAKRLSFYDTDGAGDFVPKVKIDDRDRDSCSPAADSDCWDLPDLDYKVRLGHAFPKVSAKTRPFDLAEAKKVRREDLEHDRQ